MTVVTDTSVLLNLCWLGLPGLLPKMFDAVLAPPEVREEFMRLATEDPRFRGLKFPEGITVTPSASRPDKLLPDDLELDPGESAAIALSIERGIKTILMDERAGRRLAAALGLRPFGLLGILLKAKRNGMISAVIPLIEKLRDGARFWVGEELLEDLAIAADERFRREQG